MTNLTTPTFPAVVFSVTDAGIAELEAKHRGLVVAHGDKKGYLALTQAIAELRQLAQAATPGPWRAAISSSMVNRVCTTFETVCETGKNIDDALYIAAANPAAILALIQQRDELLAALEQERKRLDWALKYDSFYDHTTGVFFCDPAFKVLNPQVRVETDDPRATIDELMVQS